MRAREVVKALESRGAYFVRQKGSHAFYRAGKCQTSVAMHKGDMPKGTVRAIERSMEAEFGERWLTK